MPSYVVNTVKRFIISVFFTQYNFGQKLCRQHLLKVTDVLLDWQQSFSFVEKFLKALKQCQMKLGVLAKFDISLIDFSKFLKFYLSSWFNTQTINPSTRGLFTAVIGKIRRLLSKKDYYGSRKCLWNILISCDLGLCLLYETKAS